MIYADFECYTGKVDPKDDEDDSNTTRYQKHVPSGFCFYLKCPDDERFSKVKKLVKYTGENVAETFIKKLEEKVKEFYEVIKYDKKCSLSKEKKKAVREEATHCHICKKELGNDRVIDHDHITGEFRGVAHNGCNLNYKTPKFFPVVFHNLANYDAHLFVKSMGCTEGDIDCIASNEEKYISFSKSLVVDTFVGDVKEVVDGEKVTVKGGDRGKEGDTVYRQLQVYGVWPGCSCQELEEE